MKVLFGSRRHDRSVDCCLPATPRPRTPAGRRGSGAGMLVNENVRERRGRRSSVGPVSGAVGGGRDRIGPPSMRRARRWEWRHQLTTTVPGQKPVEQTLVPDGSGRPIADAECRGTETHGMVAQRAASSSRAPKSRVGTQRRASISGLGLITADNTWLDIRSFRVGAGEITRVSRYRRVPSDDTALVPTVGAPLTMNEVKEAITKVTEPVLEAALAETGPRFEVNKRTLLELADAGAPPSVIDVIVALAYPERFVIERGDTQVSASAEGPIAHPYPFGIDDYYYSGFYYPSYYYSPFAFGYIGRYDPYIFGPIYGGSVPIGGNGSVRPSGTGRVINGRRLHTHSPHHRRRSGQFVTSLERRHLEQRGLTRFVERPQHLGRQRLTDRVATRLFQRRWRLRRQFQRRWRFQ